MSEYVVKGAEPNETVFHTRTPNGYEEWRWLPVREEIVRCRDCKFYLEEHKWCYHFEDSEFCPEPDGFCAWGERKDA